MGYLTDNIPPGRNHAICQDLYPYRMIVEPGFKSDVELSSIIQEEIPDIEEWQYSGRRRCPVVPATGKARPIRRKVHPAAYAQNSRYVRPFTEEVFYGFHTSGQRAVVAARFDQERVKYRLVDEPSTADDPVIIVVP